MSEITDRNYEKFKKYINTYITRDGVDRLISWLDTTDIAIAPASTKYHYSAEGGLIAHSIGVFMKLINLVKMEYGDDCPYSKEAIAIVSLLHDIEKVNKYKISMRNVKDENGQWIQQPFYQTKESNERLIYGTHAETSVYILRNFFNLSWEEETAILYHMGGLNYEEQDVSRNVISMHSANRLAELLYIADYMCICEEQKTNYDVNNFINLTIEEKVEEETTTTEE